MIRYPTRRETMSSQERYYMHRFVAQIILEATTPLKIGSGKSDLFVDAPVLKDWNGLPMILGSSIAGVLRHSCDANIQNELFGDSDTKNANAKGSRFIVGNAHLLNKDGKIIYTLGRDDDPDFLNHYDNLPVREHTAINDKGVAKKHSKFDEEVVYKGSRFKFEIEFITDGSDNDKELWEKLLSKLASPLFRLGGGSTKGFGEMKVISCVEKEYKLGVDYQSKPSDLNKPVGDAKSLTSDEKPLTYRIRLQPEDFFIFGAGFGDEVVDDVAVTEKVVKWEDKNGNKKEGEFSAEQILIPASSLKGALSHRVAFHYNKIKKVYADEISLDDFDKHIGENNDAVATLFGAAKGHAKEAKGKALFSDMFKKLKPNEVKIFDHVKIDRFTGGAVDSALYNEKVNAQKDIWEVKIVLREDINEDVRQAFENTLDDLARGWLPLGGMTGRGHGVFISPDYIGGDKNKRGWSRMGQGGSDE